MKQAGIARSQAQPRWPPSSPGLDRYALLLRTVGIERGLVGPHEGPRLWARHILNCAVVALDPALGIGLDSKVIDVGSGAGLSGLVWALVRPDLTMTLVESRSRRCDFLEESVADLGIGSRVRVVRSRAEDLTGVPSADIVTARAVAPLRRLLPWCLPLLAPNGRLLALKGASAESELSSARHVLATTQHAGSVVVAGAQWLEEPTRVLVIAPTRA